MRTALARIAAIVTDTRLLWPTNVEEEKKRFLSEEGYEPQFTYPKTDFPTTAFKEDLERYLQEPQGADERISMLVQERVRELLLWIELHENKGAGGFTDVSLRLHGEPSGIILSTAEDLLGRLEDNCPLTGGQSAEAAAPDLKKALEAEGLDWDVILIRDASRKARITSGELRLDAEARYTEEDKRRIIAREVQVGARRLKNASAQEQTILETGTAHSLETEEGLAAYNEEEAGLLTGHEQRLLAARTIAVHEALSAPFSKVYERLAPLVGEDEAFGITTMVKRGLKDTSAPGGFTMDYLPFAGWQKVKALPAEDRRLLWVGRISVLHLPVIKELVKEGKVKA